MAPRAGRRGGLPDIRETAVAQGHFVLTPGPRGLVEIDMDLGLGGLGHTTGDHTGVGHLGGTATGTGVRDRRHGVGDRYWVSETGVWGVRVGSRHEGGGIRSNPYLGFQINFRMAFRWSAIRK